MAVHNRPGINKILYLYIEEANILKVSHE
jgi:hypothetical protein